MYTCMIWYSKSTSAPWINYTKNSQQLCIFMGDYSCVMHVCVLTRFHVDANKYKIILLLMKLTTYHVCFSC